MNNQGAITDLVRELWTKLSGVSETPLLDAQVLIAHVLQKPRAWILAHPEFELTGSQARAFREAAARLRGGEPLAFILGHWEFFGLDFLVNPSVLIPRPETEHLVEQALEWLAAHPQRRLAADIGTGSGCIAVTLAVRTHDLQILATDISQAVLETAQANALRHHVEDQVDFLQTDLLAGTDAEVDLLCANLPYIPTPALRELPVFRSEPVLALDGGPDGLQLIRSLLLQAPQHVLPGGLALLEIESSQGPAALKLARNIIPAAAASIVRDLAGKDRVLRMQL